MIFGHGDDMYRFGDKIKMNFSSNVYYGADHSALKEHLMEQDLDMSSFVILNVHVFLFTLLMQLL